MSVTINFILRFVSLFLVHSFVSYAKDGAPLAFRKEPSQALIQLLSCPYENLPAELKKEEEPYDTICALLLERREIDFLLAEYSRSRDGNARYYLVSRVLYQIENPSIAKVFRLRLREEETAENYYVLNYVAKLGDKKALKILNRHYFHYPVSSLEWAYTADLFGKYNYRPAIPNLIDSLDAASLNLAGSALNSLQLLFPDSPKDFESLAEAKAYFKKRSTLSATTSANH